MDDPTVSGYRPSGTANHDRRDQDLCDGNTAFLRASMVTGAALDGDGFEPLAPLDLAPLVTSPPIRFLVKPVV